MSLRHGGQQVPVDARRQAVKTCQVGGERCGRSGSALDIARTASVNPWDFKLSPCALSVVLVSLTAAVLAWLRFRGPALGYWDTYIAVPAMMMNGAPVDVVLADGTPAWDPTLRGVLPQDLVDAARWGVATADQRFASAVAAAHGFAWLGVAGFRALFAATAALIPLACMALWQRAVGGAWWPGLIVGLWVACNPFVLAIDRLNPSLLALPGLLAVWAVAVRPRQGVAMAGLIFGTLAGMREELVVVVPALALALWRPLSPAETRSARLQRIGIFAFTCAAALLPTLHWKEFAFGNPLLHPSQYAHHHGFRPEFGHSLLGLNFHFNGLLNWPLHDTLVRTPHFAFPVWLLWPLVALRALGTVLAALALVGSLLLWRRDRWLLLQCVLWAVPLYLLFGPQENWEEVKMTFVVLALPALVLPLAEGLEAAFRFAQNLFTAHWRRSLLPALYTATIIVALTLAVVATKAVQAPADPRWTVRFPNANPMTNPAANAVLAEHERNDWQYFQRAESAPELHRERAKLTAALPWPAAYLPVRWSLDAAWQETARELSARKWQVLDIWGYIYGVRRWPQP